jgi:hypothetical protein
VHSDDPMDVLEAGPDQNSSCELASDDGSGGQHYLQTPNAGACQIGMSLLGAAAKPIDTAWGSPYSCSADRFCVRVTKMLQQRLARFLRLKGPV